MKVCIITLGCKVNQYESGTLASSLAEAGIEVVEKLCKADLHVINTCAVTSYAERKSRYELSRIIRLDPNSKVIVCGCAGQLNKSQFNSPNVIAVFGVDKGAVADFILKVHKPRTKIESLLINQEIECQHAASCQLRHNSSCLKKEGEFTRNRVYIKVQDGCNNFCAYCIVPHLRGRSRSRPIADIIEEIAALPAQVKEIVLTGIDLSSYSPHLGLLCKEVDRRGRVFRLSSLEVGVISEEFLSTLESCKNFAPSFHLSLQSGSDRVLEAMNRRYTTQQYYEKVILIRKVFPSSQITTDIICGFPTETEADFQNTVDFVKKVCFLDAHIFPYSPRSGTPAAVLPQLQSSAITKRTKELSNTCREISHQILRSYVGSSLQVLVESEHNGWYHATSMEYITVKIKKVAPLPLDWQEVRITGVLDEKFLIG